MTDASSLEGGQFVLNDTVAVFLSVDRKEIESLPSHLISHIYDRANEMEKLKSEKMVNDISWAETKLEATQQRLTSALAQVEQLEADISKLQSEKQQLLRESTAIRGQSSGNEEIIKNLEQQISSLNEDKTHLLETLDRRRAELTDYRSELESTQAKILESRKLIVKLETQVEQDRSQEMASKLKHQSLSQELQLVKQNNEWLDTELKKKTEDFKKYRNDTIAKTSQLQAKVDSLTMDLAALTKIHDSTKEHLAQMSKQYDSALVKIKDLQGSHTIAEEAFKTEMASQQRLSELWEQSAKDAKSRVEELEKSFRAIKEGESEELSQWKQAAEKERKRADDLDSRLRDIERELEESFADKGSSLDNGSRYTSPAPQDLPGTVAATAGSPRTPVRSSTPALGSPGSTAGGIGLLSPSAQVIARIQRGGGSVVQLYNDYQDTKKQLQKERIKNIDLRRQLNEVLEDMEAHGPALLAERDENRRLQVELAELSANLEKSTTNVEELTAKLKIAENRHRDSIKECDIVNKQVRDLSRQIRYLLIQQELASDEESPALSVQEQEKLNELLEGDDNEESDTGLLISQRLVLFKDIIELQKQNENLIKVTRQLGDKMEEEEKEAKARMSYLESAAVEDAKKAIIKLQGDLTTVQTRAEALKKERDMFRRMLDKKASGSHENGAQRAGEGANAAEVTKLLMANQKTTATLVEVQQNFDAYKKETNHTIQTLNIEIRQLGNERSGLQIKLSKVEGQLELTQERFKNVNDNIQIIRIENSDLRKRNQSLQESLTKQEVRTQQAAVELVEARSLLESTKSETTNLKAEKNLWKSVEARLTKENADLLEEKGRLNGLLANVNVAAEERESFFKEAEGRLKSQIESLEGQIANLHKNLDAEKEETRKLQDRRDVESKEYREKNEKLTEDLASARKRVEESQSTITSLESKIRELTGELGASTEKIALYEASQQGEAVKKQADQVASLKSLLTAKEEELRLANEHIEQLKQVAHAAEEALQSLNSTSDEFRRDIESKLQEKESRLESVEKLLAKTSEELATTGEKHSAELKELEIQKKAAEDRLAALAENESRVADMQASLKQDLDQQADIAKEAQRNYETELVKHAEATSALQKLRSDYAQVSEQIAESKSQAEAAKAQLGAAEASWESQKYTYEHEIEQLKSRITDISSQNDSLIEQLEKLSKRHAGERPTTEGPMEGGAPFSGESQIIAYLRREKEIVECNYELAQQEARRLKQRLDHTVTSLDEAKLELEKERLRQSDTLRAAADYDKLRQQLEDLNILRESNSSLRSQSDFYMKKSEKLEQEIAEAKTKLAPLENELRNAVAESEAKEKEMQLLREDNNRWKQRSQQMFETYQRVDPEEHRGLQKQVSELQAKIGELEKEKQALNEEKNAKAQEAEKYVNLFEKLKVESQTKLQRRRASHLQDKETLGAEIEKLKAELEAVRKELEEVREKGGQASSSVDAQLEALKKELAATKEQLDKQTTELQAKNTELENKSKELQSKATESEASEKLANDHASEIEKAKAEITRLQEQVKTLQESKEAPAPHGEANIADQAKVQAEKAELEKKIDDLNKEIESLKGSVKDEFGRTVDLDAVKKAWREDVVVKLRNSANLKINERKAEMAKRLEEDRGKLEKEYEEKIAQAKLQLISEGGGAAAEELAKLREDFQVQLQQAKQQGREAATKEAEMRNTLQSKRIESMKAKLEEAEKVKEELTLQLQKLKGESISPSGTAAPAGGASAVVRPQLTVKGRGGASTAPTSAVPVLSSRLMVGSTIRQQLNRPTIQRPIRHDENAGNKRPSTSEASQDQKRRKEEGSS